MDIKLTSTKSLVEELTNRFDYSVFSGVKFNEEDPVNKKEIICEVHGDIFSCLGLSINLLNNVEKEIETIYD